MDQCLKLLSFGLQLFLRIKMERPPCSFAISFSLTHHRGQGWFPVILALSVYVCCSISTSIKLFLSYSAVTESTAHACRPRGLGINHTDCVKLRLHVCVRMCAYMHVSQESSLRVTIGYEEHSFCPLDPGNANGFTKRFAGK